MFSAVYGRGSWEEVFGEVVPAGLARFVLGTAKWIQSGE